VEHKVVCLGDHTKYQGGVAIDQLLQPGGKCGRSTCRKNGSYKIAKRRRMKTRNYTMNVEIKPLRPNSQH
jgi:hypothetical protein